MNLAITYRPTAELIPYVKNARVHNESHVSQIAASIKQWGWTNPILTDGASGVIAGHGRLLAAQKLKLDQVPTIDLVGLSDADKRAYIIADNKLALNATWDTDMLGIELAELSELGVDLGLTGFTEDEINALLADKTEGLTDPDEIPEVANPIVECGDLWALGNHRLICGDSTVETDVSKLLGGVSPHLMVTDPPYGVDYDPDWRNRADRANGKPDGARAIGLVTNDKRSDWTEAWALYPGDVAYCWHAGLHASNTQTAFESCGFQLRSQIIWAKQQFAISRGDYHVQHEPCYYLVRKGKVGHYAGGRKQSTLWQIDKPVKSETGHSTQKPIECMKRPIENNSSPGQAVYDPFLGSGTTLIAAEMTGRCCYGIEIAPNYCDVIIQRWQNFTGKDAMLGDKTYNELATAKKAA
jgi:DNA modification methylase